MKLIKRALIVRRCLFLMVCGLFLIGMSPFYDQPQSVKPSHLLLSKKLQGNLQQLPHLMGSPVTMNKFENKVVVVVFFASWCVPCIKELKHLKTLYHKYHSGGLEVIAINFFEDFDGFSNAKKLQRFLNHLKPEFSVVKGNEAVSLQFGKITRIPTVFVFDRQGKSAFKFINSQQRNNASIALELEQAIASIL